MPEDTLARSRPLPASAIRRLALAVVSLALVAPLVGCGAATPGPLEPSDPTLLQRPFTAEQIRAEWVPGLHVTLHRWSRDQGESIEHMRVRDATAEVAVIEVSVTTERGEALGPAQELTATWEELRDHASYPAARATLEERRLETELGTRDCLCYRVTMDGVVTDYWFARDLPGPPVHMEERHDGELVLTLDQVTRTRE